MITDWIENLSQREKKFVFVGSVALIITLFYLLCLQPVTSYLDQLQQSVNKERELVVWMKQTIPVLQSRRLSSGETLKTISPDSGVSVIEQSLKQAHLDDSLKQITKDNAGDVSLQFDMLNFDHFIEWLISFSTENRITIMQINISPTKQTGLVKVSMRIGFDQ